MSEDIVNPRWNYKKANGCLYRHRTNTLVKKIRVKRRYKNKMTRDSNSCILLAAKECIPRGARRENKPYWDNTLQQFLDDLEEPRINAETDPSTESQNRLQ